MDAYSAIVYGKGDCFQEYVGLKRTYSPSPVETVIRFLDRDYDKNPVGFLQPGFILFTLMGIYSHSKFNTSHF